MVWPVGLQNLGNTCFCNSILQALTYSDILYDAVEASTHHSRCCKRSHTVNEKTSSEVLGATRTNSSSDQSSGTFFAPVSDDSTQPLNSLLTNGNGGGLYNPSSADGSGNSSNRELRELHTINGIMNNTTNYDNSNNGTNSNHSDKNNSNQSNVVEELCVL